MSFVKHTRLLVSVLVLLTNWSLASLAQRQTATGSGVIPLLPTGVQNGVDMLASGSTGTLSVGFLGGPQMDIFSTNVTLASPFLAVSTAASSQGNIVFNSSSTVFGAIGITPPEGPFLLNIFGGANGTVVNFQGPVQATTLNITGTGTVNFNSGSINNFPNGLIFGGDGTIGLAPNTTAIGALTTTAGTNTGTLTLGAGSAVIGAVGAGSASLKAINVVGGSNTAGVGASISGAVNAYSFSLGTNTLNIGGALTIADSTSTGLVNTTLASPTLFGNIRPVGFTTIGPTLRVNVTVPPTAVIPVGTQFNIIQTQTGTPQSGSQNRQVVVTVQDPTNPLYTFSQVPLTGTPAGLVTIVTNTIPLLVPIAPPPGVPLPPVLPIAAPIVPVLLGVSSSPELTQVLAAIGALSDPATVVNAVAQLAPSVADLAAPQVTYEVTRQFQNLWMSHLDEVMCRQISEVNTEDAVCHANQPRAGVWMKSFGFFGSQGAQGAFGGYNSTTFGTMIGYDLPLNHPPVDGETRVGFGIGYAHTAINAAVFSANTTFGTYQATAYIAHENGPWFVDSDLSFGWNDYSETRNVVFPGINQTARANYSGQDYIAFVTTGYHLFARGFTITPFTSLQYTHMNLGRYREDGAGGIDLDVQSQSYDYLESGLGVKVARSIVSPNGTYIPEVHGRWLHEFINPSIQNTAAFADVGSSSFTTPGMKTASDTLNIGAGLTFLSCACTARTWSLDAIYDFFWRADRFSANQATIRFTTRF